MSKREPGVQSLLILVVGITAGVFAGGLQMTWHSWCMVLALPAAALLLSSVPAPQPVPIRTRGSRRRN